MSDFNCCLSQLLNFFLTLLLGTSTGNTKRSTPKNRDPTSALRADSYFGFNFSH
uniref:Uncharacterized protein n=1 Tax=Siphoviridae sp. ctzpQ31 TaxID=2823613 RepID=A0A8S5L825_9CAUD|nr:MAG TPA: hypothetical protein [Siphoviridae sp. ctzpQ31]